LTVFATGRVDNFKPKGETNWRSEQRF